MVETWRKYIPVRGNGSLLGSLPLAHNACSAFTSYVCVALAHAQRTYTRNVRIADLAKFRGENLCEWF